jgi:heme/copper-type cytochrome/quinol oxidase subunit 2
MGAFASLQNFVAFLTANLFVTESRTHALKKQDLDAGQVIEAIGRAIWFMLALMLWIAFVGIMLMWMLGSLLVKMMRRRRNGNQSQPASRKI